MQIAYPLKIDDRGRVAEANEADHVRQMIEQVLFTSPGERVNRPDFGSGLQQLIFAPNSSELANVAEFTVRAALEQWLGDIIQIEALDITSADSALQILIQYVIRRTQQREVVEFSQNRST
ncbi:MAG: GPW/gp25 family protein [Synechococcales bacterium]|nr:GPW/gp25 family protein [Synechococcales bacterium]